MTVISTYWPLTRSVGILLNATKRHSSLIFCARMNFQLIPKESERLFYFQPRGKKVHVINSLLRVEKSQGSIHISVCVYVRMCGCIPSDWHRNAAYWSALEREKKERIFSGFFCLSEVACIRAVSTKQKTNCSKRIRIDKLYGRVLRSDFVSWK